MTAGMLHVTNRVTARAWSNSPTLGRLGGGFVSERCVYVGLTRPAFLAAAQLVVAAGMFVLAAFPNPGGVFASVGPLYKLNPV
jgi:hypothetical protein